MLANKNNHFAYNKTLTPLANKLRKNLTKAEACLWKYVLRAGLMKGYSFRRQRPVLHYIVDFMCKELCLIIEVDGNIHRDAAVAANDLERQAKLEEMGFSVLRFSNDDVLHKIAFVRIEIEEWIKVFEQVKRP